MQLFIKHQVVVESNLWIIIAIGVTGNEGKGVIDSGRPSILGDPWNHIAFNTAEFFFSCCVRCLPRVCVSVLAVVLLGECRCRNAERTPARQPECVCALDRFFFFC